jgi:hypothetical protein
MDVWSHGNDCITYDDQANRYRFVIDGHVKVEISDATVRVFDPRSGLEIFSIHESGGFYVQENKFEMDQVGENYLLSVGTGLKGDVRGRVEIRAQSRRGQPGDEFYMPSKAGILVLYNERGEHYFLWVDSSGKLRISSSDPGTNDASGIIVGTQS